MTCRTNVVDYRGPTIAPWPGERVRQAHAALLRAERLHNSNATEENWAEVCNWRDEYILACRDEGIEP